LLKADEEVEEEFEEEFEEIETEELISQSQRLHEPQEYE
jgi:hypothetical protein